MDPLTDNNIVEHAAGGAVNFYSLSAVLLDQPKLAGEGTAMARDLERQMVHVAFRSIGLADPADVSVDEIIKLRNEHTGEIRGTFQKEIVKLSQENDWLNQITDPTDRNKCLQDLYDKGMKAQLAELDKRLKSFGIRAGNSLKSVILDVPKKVEAPAPVC